MKKIILSAFGILMGFGLSAQFLAKDTALKQTGIRTALPAGSKQDIAVYVGFNSSAADSNYTWFREIITLPSDWTTAICDPFLCHGENTTTAKFFVPKGKTSEIINHFYMGDSSGGRGMVRLIIENDLSKDRDTTVFILDLWNELLSVYELKEHAMNNNFRVYPNPANASFLIENIGIKQVTLLRIDGTEVNSYNTANSTEDLEINTNELPNGLYLVRVKTNNGNTATQKISINH